LRDGRELPRRAAINTFGGGGSLCHVIVEEYAPDLRGLPETDTHAVDGEPALAVLSARTPERLRVMAQRLAERLQHDPGLSLADVCHTLQRGREAMAYRWAARVSTRAQLLDALSRLASGGRGGDEGVPVFLGEPEGAGSAVRELLTGRSSSAMARELIAAGDLHKLALYWSHGGHVDWSALATNGRLVSLPTYPFERRRCWLTETEQTRWEQSFVNDSTPVATQATHTDRDVATTVFETIRGMLGLGSEELDDGTSLGRYELLSAFLPRLRDKLMKENGIDIDTSLLGGQATVREVVAAATMLVTSSTDPTVSVFEDEDGQQIEMVTDPN
jgi:acyl transferase domain-containing protein